MNNQDHISEILNRVGEVVSRKNHDYDHAFDKACDLLGPSYAAGKIYEKTSRIITLSHSEPLVVGESLKDALEDCIGYCALYLNRLETNKQE